MKPLPQEQNKPYWGAAASKRGGAWHSHSEKVAQSLKEKASVGSRPVFHTSDTD